jgi:hypothetical protein
MKRKKGACAYLRRLRIRKKTNPSGVTVSVLIAEEKHIFYNESSRENTEAVRNSASLVTNVVIYISFYDKIYSCSPRRKGGIDSSLSENDDL